MIYYILLVYGNKYYKNAIQELQSLSKHIGNGDFNIIVVNNDSNVYIENTIKGDNSSYEFSGWDTAVDFLKNSGITADYIIFANDTFCHHRKWGFYQKIKFSYGFNKFIKNKRRGICGDRNSFSSNFSLLNIEMSGWISSYLFVVNSEYIFKRDMKLDFIQDSMEDYVISCSDDIGIRFKNNFDKDLAVHINNWLYPTTNNNGWYNAKNVNSEKKMAKLKSILNEKLLSANILKMSGDIYDVNDIKLIKLIKKVLG